MRAATISLLFLVLAAPALAMEGVRARLDAPVPRDAGPGETVRIAWTLAFEDGGATHPFSALGVFVRVLRPSGGEPLVAFAPGVALGAATSLSYAS